MRRLAVSIFVLVAIAAVAGATRPALAQEEPPARVGRVSAVVGQLGFHAAGETEWSAAAVNYPVATGGSFWTDPKSKAEIRIGGQTIDLSGDTEIDLTQLNQQIIHIGLPQGRIALHLRQLAEGNSVEIDVPRGGVWLLQPGLYDIDAGTPDRPARIMVFEGSARFVGGALDQGIAAGEAAVIGGTDTLTAAIEHAAPDAFVEWYRARDYPAQRLAAPYYVSPDMTGYEDLDAYGSWRAVPDYGEVWYPSSVAADWAPYRDGHWVSVEPWGWTWVDAAPWGFAPFHYGRWARIQGRWAWLPGRFVEQPVYAPALVAFIGDPFNQGPGGQGPGGGYGYAGARGPAVGWFPLGPGEVYVPSYSRNPDYIRNVNITNVSQTKITNITNTMVNQPAAGRPPQAANQNFANRAAATVVPVRTFTGAARVAPAALRVAPQALQQARIGVPPPQVAPPAGHPAAAASSAAGPTAGPGPHPPGTPNAAAPVTGPHPPGAPSAAAPIAGPGPHPPGTPNAAAPIAGPGPHPPGIPNAAAPIAGPGPHPPGIPNSATSSAVHLPPPAGPAPPPQAVHTPPPQPHPAAPAPPPQVIHTPPPPQPHPAAPPPPQVVHTPPPPQPHPAAPPPPQVIHAPPPPQPHPAASTPPPPQVIHTPPPPQPHPAAPPPPQVVHTPPPPQPHPAAPPPPQVIHTPPPPQPHPAAPAPPPQVIHTPPPPQPHPAAPPPAAAPPRPAPAPAAAPHPAAAAPPAKGDPKKKDEPK